MNAKEFWDNVATTDDAKDCWLWTRAATEKGYGVVYIDGVRWKAHRFAYANTVGPIPEGLDILHNCDNPPCCNPRHLKPGTNEDNVRDMISKGRNSPPPNNAGWNKLKIPADVLKLLGTMPDYKIAEQFGFTKSVIARRRRRLKIASYAEQSGHSGKFVKGQLHPRWTTAN